MADYSNLASLRGGLTADNPDNRAEAYQAVMNAGVQPSEVLASDPDEETVETLVEADVIPAGASARSKPVDERWERIEQLLEEIAANTGGQ